MSLPQTSPEQVVEPNRNLLVALRYYLWLHYQMLGRQIAAFGLAPRWGMVLGVLAFVGLSVWLMRQSEYAPYLYLLLAVGWVQRLGASPRNAFLRQHFGSVGHRWVRLVENGLAQLPFGLVLLAHGQGLMAGLLLVVALAQYRVAAVPLSLGATPTPFGAWPYEFAVGFRTHWPLLLLAYSLLGMGAWAANPNLASFGVLLLWVLLLPFYGQPDRDFYIWIHTQRPVAFLWRKTALGLAQASVLTLVAELFLAFYWPEYALVALGLHLLGSVYLVAMLWLRYAAHPQPVGLLEGIAFAFSLAFPPTLLLLLPYAFMLATKQLRPLIDDRTD